MNSLTAHRLPGPFGPAIDLLPKEQSIESVRHDEPVGNAIERMTDREYSQLPVKRDGEVIGLFSWRSFGRLAGKPGAATSPPEISVGDCLAEVMFLPPEAFIDTGIDWTEQDCVLVGTPKETLGLLAIYDVLGRLQDFSEAFFLIHETEHLIRNMLTDAVGKERLAEMLATMTLPPKFPRPKALTDLTFTMYGTLAFSKSRWKEFAQMFYGERAAMKDAIEAIAQIRNVVFHFKRPVTADDVDELRRFQDRLYFQRDAFRRGVRV
jgi:CBS domain protein